MIPSCALRLVLAAASSLLIVASAPAHDLWLVPGEAATAGKPQIARATSGDDFPEGDHAPDPAGFVRRLLIRPDGTKGTLEAAGKEGLAGLLRFTPDRLGVHVIAVETKPKLLALDADAFNAYLVSDGLPHIYRLRAKEKTLDRPSKERYVKSPKALVRVGEGGGDPCRVVGLPLEIVPLRDPFALKAGDTLRVRVLFQGKPLPEAYLGWQRPGDGDEPRGAQRCDANGEALVPISHAGLMTVRLIHMTRPKTEEYEWESFWTSLTFRVPEPVRRAPPPSRGR